MSVFSRVNVFNTLAVSSSTNDQVSITDNAAGSGGDYRNALVSLKPAMSASENYIYSIGNNTNANNAGYVGFRYTGDGSLDNNMTIGLYDNNHLLNVYKSKVTIPMTTESDSTSTGALTVSGGISIAKNLYVGGTINGTFNISSVPSLTITDTTDASSFDSGALVVRGGVGIAKSLIVSGETLFNDNVFTNFQITAGKVIVSTTTESSSSTLGALTVAGGLGVAKNLNVGGSITASNIASTTLTGDITGPFSASGVSIGKIARVGNVVTLWIDGYSASSDSANFFVIPGIIPAAYRLASPSYVMGSCTVKDGGAATYIRGNIYIENNGDIRIYKAVSTEIDSFSSSGIVGYHSMSISWVI